MAKTTRWQCGGERGTWRTARVSARAAALSLALAACGEAAVEGVHDVATLELTEIARFDGSASGEGAGFGAIADIEIGAGGVVYVVDRMNRLIHAFDPAGNVHHTFGGRGGGPGELEEPVAMFLGAGDELWVVDARNARYTVFDRTGALRGTWGSTEGQVFHPLSVGYSDGGRLLTVALEFGRLERPVPVLVEGAPGDAEVRTVRQTELPFISWPAPFELSGDGMMFVVPVPFTAEPTFQIGGDGALWFASDGPEVHRWTVDAGIEQSYGVPFDAPPVTAAEREAALADPEYDELRAAAGPAGVADFTRRMPSTKPHLRGFFVADDSSVWIMRTVAAGSARLPRIDVYDSAGTPIGVAYAPIEAEPRPRVRQGLLAGVVRDELGVESVVVYRIGPAS